MRTTGGGGGWGEREGKRDSPLLSLGLGSSCSPDLQATKRKMGIKLPNRQEKICLYKFLIKLEKWPNSSQLTVLLPAVGQANRRSIALKKPGLACYRSPNS